MTRLRALLADWSAGEGHSEAQNSRLTTRNLRRKSLAEEQEARRQADMEDQLSGNLESIAESSQWEGEESDEADSAAVPQKT